jgi:hypothetical protein
VKKKRFSVEQITTVLKQAEAGAPVGDLCRQVGNLRGDAIAGSFSNTTAADLLLYY